jgi:hypothetical protein
MQRATILWISSVLTCLAAASACAQQVFKCEDRDSVVYQSQPCEGATLRSWDAVPDVIDPAIQAHIESLRSELRPTRRPAVQRRADRRRQAPAVSACERARHGRAAAYEKAGLKRDFKLSSHWDNRVHDACR